VNMLAFAGERLFLLGSALLAIGTAGFYNIPGMISADAEGSLLINSIYVRNLRGESNGFWSMVGEYELDTYR